MPANDPRIDKKCPPLSQFINQQTSPDNWKYHYYLGAKLDFNFVGTHRDGMHWTDNNNEIDGEYKLVNTFESWNTGEPNNDAGIESCVAVGWSKEGWNDAPCGQRNYNVVCEERRHSDCSDGTPVTDGSNICQSCNFGYYLSNTECKRRNIEIPFYLGTNKMQIEGYRQITDSDLTEDFLDYLGEIYEASKGLLKYQDELDIENCSFCTSNSRRFFDAESGNVLYSMVGQTRAYKEVFK